MSLHEPDRRALARYEAVLRATVRDLMHKAGPAREQVDPLVAMDAGADSLEDEAGHSLPMPPAA